MAMTSKSQGMSLLLDVLDWSHSCGPQEYRSAGAISDLSTWTVSVIRFTGPVFHTGALWVESGEYLTFGAAPASGHSS
jgi:hypothetical protein